MDDILRAAVAASAENPGHLHTLVSCCGHLGLAEEAADSIATRNRLGAAPPTRRAPPADGWLRAWRGLHRRSREDTVNLTHER